MYQNFQWLTSNFHLEIFQTEKFSKFCQPYEMVTNRGMTRRRPWSKICSPMSSSFWLMQAQRPESLAFALLISISAERKYAIYQLPSIKYIWEGKGRIFWEGHKNLSHPPLYFDVKYSVASNKKVEDRPNFCGLFRTS